MRFAYLTSALCWVLSLGCSWVSLTDQGREVQVVANAEVTDCQRLGNARAKVLPRLWFVPRPGGRVQSELRTLARNEGARLGGNTVTAMPERVEGERVFAVYRCDG